MHRAKKSPPVNRLLYNRKPQHGGAFRSQSAALVAAESWPCTCLLLTPPLHAPAWKTGPARTDAFFPWVGIPSVPQGFGCGRSAPCRLPAAARPDGYVQGMAPLAVDGVNGEQKSLGISGTIRRATGMARDSANRGGCPRCSRLSRSREGRAITSTSRSRVWSASSSSPLTRL